LILRRRAIVRAISRWYGRMGGGVNSHRNWIAFTRLENVEEV
jgi:hypothetical protein